MAVTTAPTTSTGKRPVKPIRDFFGMNLSEMKAEWMGKDPKTGQEIVGVSEVTGGPLTLTAADKEQLLDGLENGSLTY